MPCLIHSGIPHTIAMLDTQIQFHTSFYSFSCSTHKFIT
jgi:hypothetical protein